jgi:hypothetical protein
MELQMYEAMSAFELADLQTTYQGLTNSTITAFTSATFAYIVLCYLAASKLTRNQLFAVSIVYSIFMLIQIVMLVSYSGNTMSLQRHIATVYSDREMLPTLTFFFYPIAAFIGWLMSITYMWSLVRRK